MHDQNEVENVKTNKPRRRKAIKVCPVSLSKQNPVTQDEMASS